MSALISTLVLLTLGASSAVEPGSTMTAAPYINLVDNLDEKNDVGWCLDLKGFGASIEFIDMQTHSCKDTGEDVNFAIGDGRRVRGAGDADGRCLSARSTQAGSAVDAPLCDASDPQQEIAYCSDGTLRLNAGDLCLVAGDESRNAGPKWMARDLNFEECNNVPTILKTWAYLAIGSADRIVGGDEDCSGTSAAPTTLAPTTTAPSICLDSILGISAGSGAKCPVIAANIEYCDNNVVKSHCPLVCDACAQYECADSDLSWDYGGGSYTCTQLGSLSDSDIETYCELEALYSTCRRTCKLCVETPPQTLFPTRSPTSVPSSSPIKNPTVAPVECTNGGTYYFKSGLTGVEFFDQCIDLEDKTEDQQIRRCDTDESGTLNGVTYGPAKDVCRYTCDTCGDNPMKHTLR